MKMKNALLVFLAFVTVANTVPAAFGLSAPVRLRQSTLKMNVEVSPQANDNNPVAFDLVLVTDKMLLEELGKLSASEWFKNRNHYRLVYPEETGLSAGSWEFVPGQVVVLEPITVKGEVVGGVIFANYFTAGEHRAVIDARKSFAVHLGADSFTVRLEK
jgi:type VI secretion system protein